MRILIAIVSVLLFFACTKKEPQGINFVVHDKNDTLAYFYYNGSEKYFFYHNEMIEKAPRSDKGILLKMPGVFVMGLRNRIDSVDRLFIFKQGAKVDFAVIDKPSVPFLYRELNIDSTYDVIFAENYVDSSGQVIHKVETQFVLDDVAKDTIVYQELNYFNTNDASFVALFIYRNKPIREEMRLLIKDAKSSIDQAIEK
jgi:hypothetical protein